ncbi:MAG: hypothetical protein HY903_12950 [Deltaproteobacteria bacterium]|nr:hypothetical protein [Deltaproteobacteria bacterium]
MKARIVSFFAVITIAAVAACSPLSDEKFRRAIPSDKSVTVNAPERDANALTSIDATLGATSDYYVTTRRLSRGINGGVRSFVGLIRQIVSQPVTSRDGDRRIWGPGADALDPVFYRLVATEESPDHFAYALEARPKASEDLDANYLPLISGTSDISSGKNDGKGTLTLHLDNAVTMDPSACGTGSLDAIYDTTGEPQFLTVAFNDFSTCDEEADGKKPMQAASYYFARAADGSGNFQFIVTGDVHNGALLPLVDETFAIRSRWLPTGEGRSDVSISGGDLLAHDGIAAVTASECWDSSFALTFQTISPAVVDPSHLGGLETACPAGLQTAEYTSDL